MPTSPDQIGSTAQNWQMGPIDPVPQNLKNLQTRNANGLE